MADKARRIAAWLCCIALAGCAQEPPEQRLRATIAAMESAVEEKRTDDFLAHVAEDFSADQGSVDRTGLRRILAANQFGSESITVLTGPLDITLHGTDRATVRTEVVVTGGRFLPERGEHFRLESGWRVEDGEWVCYVARRDAD